MAEIKTGQQSTVKKESVLVSLTNITNIPYDNSDRLVSTQAWLKDHPEVHKRYVKIKSDDGKDLWINQEGNPVKRIVERERLEIQRYLEPISKPLNLC